jgi:hypothetical protein
MEPPPVSSSALKGEIEVIEPNHNSHSMEMPAAR